MAPCPPQVLVDLDLWNCVKRDSSNIIVLQANTLKNASDAAFGNHCGECCYRIVIMGDDGLPLAVIAQSMTLKEGEKDWEWAVIAFKTEFRRRIPSQHKIIEHFVALWNKSHRNMTIAQPQWKKETGTEIEMKEMREVLQCADSEANIVDSATYRMLHVLDFVDGNGFPQPQPPSPSRKSPSSRMKNYALGLNSPRDHENKHKIYEAALNAYRVPHPQPSKLPGHHHSLEAIFPSSASASSLSAVSRPVTTMFKPAKPSQCSRSRTSFNGNFDTL